MSELIVRPAHNDHRLIEGLLAPTGGVRHLRPVLNRLVLDAQVAAKQPAFTSAAEASGTPVLIDPLTFFLQGEVRDDDPWRRLPFASRKALVPDELSDRDFQQDLVSRVVEFEVSHGATGVVPPYLLLGDDPRLLTTSQDLLRGTRAYLDDHHIAHPLLPVIAILVTRQASSRILQEALDVLADEAIDAGATGVALAMSGVGAPDDGADRVHLLLVAIDHLVRRGLSVVAWRQGLLGPCTVAAGAIGYECGIGSRERCDLVSLQRSRRPGPVRSGSAPPAGVFIQPFGRSIPRPVARVLLEDHALRARLVCDSEQCCPNGVESMLENPRRHAVVARARFLGALDRMPTREWRLNAVAREAESGAVLSDLASRVLKDQGRQETVNGRALAALTLAADLLREEGGRVAS